jgi:hypothetical protein
MSAFSAMRFLRAFLLTSVRRMAHVTTLDATMRIVAASTIQPPHSTCGTNRRISTRKARRVTSSVGMVRIRRARRKRGEWPGAWKWAAMAREKHIKTRRAAMGCTIRIEDRLVRVVEGSEKSSAWSPEKRPSSRSGQNMYCDKSQQTISPCRSSHLTCGISDLLALASVALTIAKDTEIIALVAAQRDGLDDGCGDGAQKQQYEGQEEDDGQRCCRAQHGGRWWSESNECGWVGEWVCARFWPATRTDGECREGERARRRASDQTGFDRR